MDVRDADRLRTMLKVHHDAPIPDEIVNLYDELRELMPQSKSFHAHPDTLGILVLLSRHLAIAGAFDWNTVPVGSAVLFDEGYGEVEGTLIRVASGKHAGKLHIRPNDSETGYRVIEASLARVADLVEA
jgi:hypothetical protein